MTKHTHSKHNSTISFGGRLFILIILASILSSCGTVLQTPVPIVASNVLSPTPQALATQELISESPTEVATEISIPNLKLESPTEVATEISFPNITLESATAVEDLRKLKELFETNMDIDNLVLASEQVFSDFYNKVIPDISNLRFRSPVELTERLNIGVPVYYHRGIHGDNARVQAIIMGGFTTDNGAYVLLGTENSATGDRLIVPVQFTFGYEGSWSTVGIREDHDPLKTMQYWGTLDFISADELLIIVNERLGKDLLTDFLLFYPPERPIAEESRIANQNFNLLERFKLNDLFLIDPLSIDKNNLLESPWVSQLYY